MPSFGEVIEVFTVESVTVTRRYGCARRDQYELTVGQSFPPALRDTLAARGAMRGSAQLYVLDVPGEYQLTVAPAAGRAVLMPRMSTTPDAQRSAAVAVAGVIAAELAKPRP